MRYGRDAINEITKSKNKIITNVYNLCWHKFQICVLWNKDHLRHKWEIAGIENSVQDTTGIKTVSPVWDLLFMWQEELCPPLALCNGTIFRDAMIKAIIRSTWWAVEKESLLRSWGKVKTNQWRVFRWNQNCLHSEIRLSDSNCNKKFSRLLRWLSGEKHIRHKHDDMNSMPESTVKRENQLLKLKANLHMCAMYCVVLTHTNTLSITHTYILSTCAYTHTQCTIN